ncbi:hypothetical protein Hanom_Chr09g00839571 [Helianthus anomalus]
MFVCRLNFVMCDADDIFRVGWWVSLVSQPQSLIILVIKPSVLGRQPNLLSKFRQWFHPLVPLQIIEKYIRMTASSLWSHHSMCRAFKFFITQHLQYMPNV